MLIGIKSNIYLSNKYLLHPILLTCSQKDIRSLASNVMAMIEYPHFKVVVFAEGIFKSHCLNN